MKLLILLALAPVSAFAQIDWRATVCQNLYTDLRQTMSFDGKEVVEKNPFWRGVYQKPEFPVIFTASQALTASWIERQKQKEKIWALWGIVQIAFVWNNRKWTGYGIPVLSIRF